MASHITSEVAPGAKSTKYPQFILFGDSIIQYSSFLSNGGYHFGAGLEEHCSRRLDVVNKGLSGYNTSNALKVLEDIIPDPSVAKVDYLLILFGANDACLPDCPTNQHVPLELYTANLRTLITHPLILAHKPHILLVTPPILNEAHLLAEDTKKGFPSVSRTNVNTSDYAAAVRDVAASSENLNVHVVDLWKAMMQVFNPKTGKTFPPTEFPNDPTGDSPLLRSLLVDGLHLTGEGYALFLKEVLPLVGPSWASEPLNAPSWIFPHWSIAPK